VWVWNSVAVRHELCSMTSSSPHWYARTSAVAVINPPLVMIFTTSTPAANCYWNARPMLSASSS
jgi:hypothetical protein